ncbi:dipeptidyl peptidase 9 [Culicoides brevitarsis]|uniref:dipeptidyl peptidase 9 n=1 Tax=Culicoides brevitarsis TaxID=469753 RepID=UPI00307C5A93
MNGPDSTSSCSNSGSGSGYIRKQPDDTNSAGKTQKTWSELKNVVNDIRKQMQNLSCLFPMNIKFRTLADDRVRIYFLSIPPNGWGDTTLLYVDVGPDTPSHEMYPQRLQLNVLLEPTSSLATGNSFSREMQLLLERKRLSIWGITSYEMHNASGKIVFPACSTLYHCLDTGFNTTPLFPWELRICQTWAAIDPQICPKNSDLIAYICGGDIWVTHTQSGHEHRLTYAHDGRKALPDDPLSAGVPSYVMQEEFSRYEGFWWQPDSEDDIFRIVYEEVDESDVGLYTFPSSQSVGGEYEEYRFPRAGSPNAKSKLKLVQFRLSEALQITDVCIKDLQCPLNYSFPWLEYIVRVGWTPNSKFLWAQLLDRLQQHLVVVLIPVDNFCEPYESASSTPSHDDGSSSSWRSPSDKSSSPLQVIYQETSSTWINVHDLLRFIEITDNTCTFLWASEETGFRHLYLITSSLACEASSSSSPPNGLKMDQNIFSTASCKEEINLSPRIISKVTLTKGEWEVLAKNIWVDTKRCLVYFLGLKETPLEKHLYAVSYRKADYTRILTTRGFSYTVELNDDCSMMLQASCNLSNLPKWEVIKIAHDDEIEGVDSINLVSMGILLENSTPKKIYSPIIYTPKISSGDILYAMVFKPHNFKLGVKYPTILNVYGGPEVQTVSNTFKGMRQLRMHMLASQGYCVICIDSRGSQHRGVKFESHIRHRMGTVELADQVEVLKKLSDTLGYIDMDRVAIHGWSYGGYLSLMGLIQYPDIFKVSIAGAPVTNWEYYDTGYTERYMDLPENNRVGYLAGSVLSYINEFPDDDNRLLIIHGLIDENVHFFHTSQLVNALIKANKPYKLQIYPNERHSIRNLEASKHYETTLLSFLQSNL